MCLYIYIHASHSTYVEVKEQVGQVRFLFPPSGSQGPIQVTRLGSEHLCILRHLASVSSHHLGSQELHLGYRYGKLQFTPRIERTTTELFLGC